MRMLMMNRVMNKTAIRAFILLLTGTLIIIAATLFIFNVYLTSYIHRIGRLEVIREMIRTVRLVSVIPPNELTKRLDLLAERGVNVAIRNTPLDHSYVIRPIDHDIDHKTVRALHRYLQNQRDTFRVSVALTENRWLLIRGRVVRHPWFDSGLLISAVLLLTALVLLCGGIVLYLAIPVRQFMASAERFGVDMQSPPIPMSGTPEVKAVIRAFNDVQARMRRLLTDRTQMLAAISHDLRTPITRLQLRLENFKDHPQYEKAAADLQDMERMIASILSFARDYARREPNERFDLDAFLSSICDDLQDAGYPVDYQGPERRVPWRGRLLALKRAFSNVIENAVKYGQVAHVQLIWGEGRLQVKIIDEGPGIPDAELEKVFDPFYRVDVARTPSQAGTGLGLAVARDIIRAHGGDIRLINREPSGLMVLIDLPDQVI